MTQSIHTALDKASSFQELHEIVRKAEPRVSCLGGRYVVARGYSNWVDHNALAKKTMALVKKNFEFSEGEREIGKKIASKLDRIYKALDNKLQRLNILSYILYQIRKLWSDLFTCGYDTQFHWEGGGDNKMFEYYTEKQYKAVYGIAPSEKLEITFDMGLVKRWNPSSKSFTDSNKEDIEDRSWAITAKPPAKNKGLFSFSFW